MIKTKILQKLKKYLGITISKDLTFYAQLNKAATNAIMILRLTKRTFKSNTWKNTWKNINTSYNRPHLEYPAPVWNPLAREIQKNLKKFCTSQPKYHTP